MRCLLKFIPAIVALMAVAGCARSQPEIMAAHARVRVLVKKDNAGVCKSRTIPKSHAVLKGEETEIVWDIKVKDNCLDDSHLVLKWVDARKNPTICAEVSTSANGNKTRIRCNLVADPVVGTGYDYKVYLRKGTEDILIEDPDVEIVMF